MDCKIIKTNYGVGYKLELQNYTCCGSVAKIHPISKRCGSYCPICGVIDYE